jgi:DnaJ-class molecular chaperone
MTCTNCVTPNICENERQCTHEDQDDTPTGAWIICPHCEGDGSHSKRFGAMTQSEFEEAFDDEESREDYFAGAYDERCSPCSGTGKIRDTEESRAALDRAYEQERIALTGRNSAGEPMW